MVSTRLVAVEEISYFLVVGLKSIPVPAFVAQLCDYARISTRPRYWHDLPTYKHPDLRQKGDPIAFH